METSTSGCKYSQALPPEIWLQILGYFSLYGPKPHTPEKDESTLGPAPLCGIAHPGKVEQLLTLLRVCRLFRAGVLPFIFGTLQIRKYDLLDHPKLSDSCRKKFIFAIINRDEHALRTAGYLRHFIFSFWCTQMINGERLELLKGRLHKVIHALSACINLERMDVNASLPFSVSDITRLVTEMPNLTTLIMDDPMALGYEHEPLFPTAEGDKCNASLTRLHTLECSVNWAVYLSKHCPKLLRLRINRPWEGTTERVLSFIKMALKPNAESLQHLCVPWQFTKVGWTPLVQLPNLETLQLWGHLEGHFQSFYTSPFFQDQIGQTVTLFPNLYRFEAILDHWSKESGWETRERTILHTILSNLNLPKVELVRLSMTGRWKRVRWAGNLALDWVVVVDSKQC